MRSRAGLVVFWKIESSGATVLRRARPGTWITAACGLCGRWYPVRSWREVPPCSSRATVFLFHIAPALVSSHQLGNSIFLSHHSSSSLPNTMENSRSRRCHGSYLSPGEYLTSFSCSAVCLLYRLSVLNGFAFLVQPCHVQYLEFHFTPKNITSNIWTYAWSTK